MEIESERYAQVTGFPALPGWRDREADPRFPLSLVTPKRADRTHSQLGDRSSPLGPADHALQMNPADAARRGIAAGDEVRLFNRSGLVHVRVNVTDDIMPGVVSLHEGVWVQLDANGEDRAGSVNLLSDTGGTGPAHSCVMHALPVEVARAADGPETAAP